MSSVAPNHIFCWGLGTDHAINWKYRHGGAGKPWSGWNHEGGTWSEDPVVASRGVGEAAIFLVDLKHGLHHANYNFMKDNGVGAFKPLGGTLSSPPAVANRKGTLHILYIGSDHALYHKSWDGTRYNPADGYEKLGGLFLYSPTAVSAGGEEVSVFAVGLTDGRLHHHFWKSNSGWHPTENGTSGTVESLLHVGALPGLWVGTPCAISTKEGDWDVFGVNAEGSINHLSFIDGKLSELEVIPGQICQTVDAISVAPGTIDIFGWGVDGSVHHKSWNSKTWGEWEDLEFSTVKRPRPVSDSPAALDVVGVGPGSIVRFNSRNKNTGKWSGWAVLGGTFISRIA